MRNWLSAKIVQLRCTYTATSIINLAISLLGSKATFFQIKMTIRKEMLSIWPKWMITIEF